MKMFNSFMLSGDNSVLHNIKGFSLGFRPLGFGTDLGLTAQQTLNSNPSQLLQ
jgi:hypothetical protein